MIFDHFREILCPSKSFKTTHLRNQIPAKLSTYRVWDSLRLTIWSKYELHKKWSFLLRIFNKCDQICRKLRIWSHLLKKSIMENSIFCAVMILIPIHHLSFLIVTKWVSVTYLITTIFINNRELYIQSDFRSLFLLKPQN